MKINEYLFSELLPEYFYELNDVLKFRVISKNFKEAIDNRWLKYNSKIHYDGLLDTISTFIPISYCWNCNTSVSSANNLNYLVHHDNNPKRMIIVCHKWQCRIKATHTILDLLEQNNCFYLINPLDTSLSLVIPRSDPSINTIGEFQDSFSHLILNTQNGIHVRVNWYTSEDTKREFYYKWVSIHKLIEKNPTIKDMLMNLKVAPFHSSSKVKQLKVK